MSTQNGKGSSTRNCFSEQYKRNYDRIFKRTAQRKRSLRTVCKRTH